MDMPEKWVTMDEICEHIGATRYTVKKWIDERGLPGVKVGKYWKFKISKVDEWILAGGAADEKTN